jgi:NADH:ubiquinone oxidoreductase subunit 5 (subunit L)/multisubunit Na+/H+ antiporter MnhA subunit
LLVLLNAAGGSAALARVAAGGIVAALLLSLAGLAGPDRLGAFVACAVAAIAAIVVGYASRSMQGGSVPYARFFATIAAATAGSLFIATAADLRVLAAAWVVTGWSTSALLASASDRPAAQRWARRHAGIDAVGTVAWIAILLLAAHAYGSYDLAAIARAAGAAPAPLALALAIVVAGATRSALVPFHTWLPNSMEAPTPVSAFMHAGLVNGAGILFAKTAFVLAGAPAALTAAALLGAATAALGATIALVRPESKRRLGWSTVAQMGFMVLQCGCGAFAGAIVHLVAHGGYKSSAFLGVPGSIVANATARRRTVRTVGHHPVVLAAAGLAPPAIGVLAAGALAGHALATLPAAGLVVALAWTAGVCAARALAERALDVGARLVGVGLIALAVAAYLLAVVALDAWIGGGLPRLTFVPATVIAAALVVLAGILEGCGIRPRGGDTLYTLALVEGRAVPLPA